MISSASRATVKSHRSSTTLNRKLATSYKLRAELHVAQLEQQISEADKAAHEQVEREEAQAVAALQLESIGESSHPMGSQTAGADHAARERAR